jgi:predicted 3-demethylubiquinone-9 3-methyltransferase (glyoxalase superfamily)
MATITPFFWYDADLTEVIAHYRSVFPDAVAGEVPDSPVMTATIELCGQQLQLFNGGPQLAGFNEAISLVVILDTQDEIDDIWDRFLSGGGEPSQCGWLKDRYGLSWQIVPAMLGSVLGGPDPRRAQQAQQAMLQMVKLDIAALQAAYDG